MEEKNEVLEENTGLDSTGELSCCSSMDDNLPKEFDDYSEESDSKKDSILGLGIGALVIGGIGYGVYRLVKRFKKKKADDPKEVEEPYEDVDSENIINGNFKEVGNEEDQESPKQEKESESENKGQ